MGVEIESQAAEQAASTSGNAATSTGVGAAIGTAIMPGVGTLVGAGAGWLANQIFGGSNRQTQLQQQAALSQQQLGYNEQMANYNLGLQEQLWHDTNYSAQVQEAQKAGLNPALIYGGSGGGGATASIAGGAVNGPSANDQAQVEAALSQNSMQLEQAKVMESQANLNNAQAAKIAGVDTQKATAETESITQGITNQKVQAELQKAQTDLTNVTTKFQHESYEYRMDNIAQQANISLGQAQSAMANGDVDQQTAFTKVQMIKTQAITMQLEQTAINSNIQLNQAKIKEIAAGIQQKWQELNINEANTHWTHEDRVNAMIMYTDNALKVAGIVAAGNTANQIVKVATMGQ